jgi:hypothetical protein
MQPHLVISPSFFLHPCLKLDSSAFISPCLFTKIMSRAMSAACCGCVTIARNFRVSSTL